MHPFCYTAPHNQLSPSEIVTREDLLIRAEQYQQLSHLGPKPCHEASKTYESMIFRIFTKKIDRILNRHLFHWTCEVYFKQNYMTQTGTKEQRPSHFAFASAADFIFPSMECLWMICFEFYLICSPRLYSHPHIIQYEARGPPHNRIPCFEKKPQTVDVEVFVF